MTDTNAVVDNSEVRPAVSVPSQWSPSATIESTSPKGILQSKTIWGIAIMALARWLGHDMDSATAGAITGDVVVIVGALLAIWGRLSAQKPIDSVV